MNPFGGPIPISSPAVPANHTPGTSGPVGGLAPVQQTGAGVPNPPTVNPKPTKGIPGVTTAESLEKALVPISAAVGAVVQPEGPFAKKLFSLATGFKVGEAGEVVNKLTPGAAMFLLPEPFGFLPERSLMEKPRVPGTNLYLDPVYTFRRYQARQYERDRERAVVVQTQALRDAIPNLDDPVLRAIIIRPDVRAQYLPFVDPKLAEQLAVSELSRRDVDRARVDLIEARHERALGLAPAFPTGPSEGELLAEAVASFYAGDLAPLLSVTSVLGGSTQPVRVRPINGAAIRNEDAAEGIRRDLVHERADP